jgi:hypothetical protein
VSRPQSPTFGDDFEDTVRSYHLNISEKKKLPKAASVSLLDMKLRNSSALLRKASLMLSFSFCFRRNSMLLF